MRGPQALRAGKVFLLVVVMGIGCATSVRRTPVASPAAVNVRPAQPANPDQVAKRFWDFLKASNATEAASLFNEKLKIALPAAKLSEIWLGLTKQYGVLVKASPLSKDPVGATVVERHLLVFERGRLTGQLTVERGDGSLTGIYFLEAPPEGKSSNETEPPVSEGSDGDIDRAEVVIGSERWRIKAVITKPRTEKILSVAIIVPGSGPQDRDGTVGPNKPMRWLADALAHRGIATLRYDKRAVAHKEAFGTGFPTIEQEYLEDAQAAAAFIKGRPEFSGSAVVVLGHSFGAIVATRLAQDIPMAGVIMFGAPGKPLTEVIVDQLVSTGQVDADGAGKLRDEARALATDVHATGMFVGAPAVYWRDMLAWQRQASTAVTKLPIPLALIFGGRDYQIPSSHVKPWRELTKKRSLTSIRIVTTANHLMLHGNEPSSPNEYTHRGRLDPEVVEVIAAFITDCAKRDRKRSRRND